jgi:hypothetical protein
MRAVREKGPEPQLGMPTAGPLADADLLRLQACWSALPPHFKQTIMTLVEIVESKQSPPPGELRG